MNPFANPEESQTYEYEEFPKAEAASAVPSLEEIPASGSFVDFLRLKDMPEEDPTPQVQTIVLQDFKQVLPHAQEA